MRKWLAQKRNIAGLTQAEVASKAGIARTTYSMIETGERNTSVENAKKIGKILNFDWTIFFGEKCHETCINSA